MNYLRAEQAAATPEMVLKRCRVANLPFNSSDTQSLSHGRGFTCVYFMHPPDSYRLSMITPWYTYGGKYYSKVMQIVIRIYNVALLL